MYLRMGRVVECTEVTDDKFTIIMSLISEHVIDSQAGSVATKAYISCLTILYYHLSVQPSNIKDSHDADYQHIVEFIHVEIRSLVNTFHHLENRHWLHKYPKLTLVIYSGCRSLTKLPQMPQNRCRQVVYAYILFS